MQPKYNLGECTEEESSAFMKDFNELLNKHSVFFEPVPVYSREGLVKEDGTAYPWTTVCQIMLKKKTPVVEVVEAVPSPFTDESPKEA